MAILCDYSSIQLSISISVLFVIYFAIKCYKIYYIWQKLSDFPRPKSSSSILGNWSLLTQPSDQLGRSMRNIAKECYPHYVLRICLEFSVNLLTPEDCEIILGTKKHTEKSRVYVILRNWLRDGLLLSKGDKWMERRRILTPTFHFNILKNFFGVFIEESDKLIETILKQSSEPVNIVPLASGFALRTINETAMGHQLDSKIEDQSTYQDAICEIEEVFVYRLMRPWLYVPLLFRMSQAYRKEKNLLKILHSFTRNIIQKRMQTPKNIKNVEESDEEDVIYLNQKKRRLAMLDILIENHRDRSQINYDGICEEVDTFMFEGHDTTATAIAFCLMLIGNHPAIQEQIFEEIQSVLGRDRTNPMFKDLQKMELLERTIKESLRLYPSVHFISRLCEEDVVLHSGLVVPKGVNVHVHVIDIHRNPKVFPEPDKFDPDRFLPENCQGRHPFAYLPFSAGPRNCIGQKFAMMEMKVVLAKIIQRFKIIPVDTPETIVLKPELILRAKNGIKMKFCSRY